tara:strand:- start:1042 stop:1434 length:393 start_codon:yes stop_codon:yes gene_type:complete
MKNIKTILTLVVSTTIINVWLFRFNDETIYRGGDALNMLEEFNIYGFSETFTYIIGFIKVSCALALLLSIYYNKILLPAALVIIALMSGALVMHFTVSDEIIKFLPAALVLIATLTIVFLNNYKYSSNEK